MGDRSPTNARLRAQGLLHQRRELLDEAGVAAQLHLETQALAFVQGRRAGIRHRLAQPLTRQVLLVAAVAGFVHGAHQAAQEIVFTEARGQTHVLGHATAERVRADIQPAGLEVKAQQAHHLLAQRALRWQREGPHRIDHMLAGLSGADQLDQARQPLPHLGKDLVELQAGHARLVAVHQRVVLAHTVELRQQLGLFAPGGEHGAEVLDKPLPVVGRALRAPGVFAARRGHLLALHQRLGQGIGRAPLAPHLAQVGALQVRQRFLLGACQLVGQLRVGAQAVQQRSHLCQRGGSRLVALGRHVGRLIPAGDRLQVRQAVQTGPGIGQIVVAGGGCGWIHARFPCVARLWRCWLRGFLRSGSFIARADHKLNCPGKTHSKAAVMIA
jgi:hypothetical protein